MTQILAIFVEAELAKLTKILNALIIAEICEHLTRILDKKTLKNTTSWIAMGFASVWEMVNFNTWF